MASGIGNSMESHFNTRKRLKQACKNCRRKKARCPGERPICSFCSRLKQVCEYDDVQPSVEIARTSSISKQTKSKLADRVAQLESRLSLIATASQSTDPTPETSPTFSALPYESPSIDTLDEETDHAVLAEPQSMSTQQPPPNYTNVVEEEVRPDSSISKFQRMPPQNIVLAAINQYFQRFHCRPFTFFHEDNFHRNFELGNIPSYLILAIVANVASTSFDPWFEGRQTEAAKTVGQTAWLELLTKVLPDEDAVNITAIQALGLLCHSEYRSGRYQSGNMKLRIALTLAQNLRMTSEPKSTLLSVQQEEQRCLTWTLFIIDKLSSAVLDRKSVLSDKECLLRLPENEQVFQTYYENRMPNLKQAKAATIPKDSSFAKMVLLASVIGTFVRTPIKAESSRFPPFWHPDGGYAQLKKQMQHVTDLCEADMLGPQSVVSDLKNQQIGGKGVVSPGIGYRLYTQVNYHILSIAINHPFFIRQQLSVSDAQCPPDFIRQTLKACQEHAEMLTRFATIVQQFDLSSHMSLFPGYVTYISAIVHFLFMHSPDLELANKSRELFRRSQYVLLRVAAENSTTQPQAYGAALEALQQNSGVASLLVDPNATSFRYRTQSTSIWRMLDLNWLGEQLCIKINMMPSLPASLTKPQPAQCQRHRSLTANSSEDTPSDSSRTSSVDTPQMPSSTSQTPDQDPPNTLRKDSTKTSASPDIYAFGLASQNLSMECSSPHPSANETSTSDSMIYQTHPLTSMSNNNIGYEIPPPQFQIWKSDPGMIQAVWTDNPYEQFGNQNTSSTAPSFLQPHGFSDEYLQDFRKSVEAQCFSRSKSISGNKRYASMEPN